MFCFISEHIVISFTHKTHQRRETTSREKKTIQFIKNKNKTLFFKVINCSTNPNKSYTYG